MENRFLDTLTVASEALRRLYADTFGRADQFTGDEVKHIATAHALIDAVLVAHGRIVPPLPGEERNN